jgi:hypothetical protein
MSVEKSLLLWLKNVCANLDDSCNSNDLENCLCLLGSKAFGINYEPCSLSDIHSCILKSFNEEIYLKAKKSLLVTLEACLVHSVTTTNENRGFFINIIMQMTSDDQANLMEVIQSDFHLFEHDENIEVNDVFDCDSSSSIDIVDNEIVKETISPLQLKKNLHCNADVSFKCNNCSRKDEIINKLMIEKNAMEEIDKHAENHLKTEIMVNTLIRFVDRTHLL